MRDAFAIGRKVYVRALERADLPAMVPWINDHEVTSLLFTGHRPALLERLEAQWEREASGENEVVFAVCRRDGDRFVGTCGLYTINWIMRTAEFRIFLGDRPVWNSGLGTDATRLMVAYGFQKLNLNRIWLGVNAENMGGLRAYEKAGFVREGVLRQEQYRNLRYYDVIRMGMLRNDYEAIREGYLRQDD